MFCSKCGKELFDEAVVCPNCGCPTSNYVENQNKPVYIKSNLSTTKAWCKIGTLLGLFITLIGLICGIIGMSKANSALNQNPDDEEALDCKNWGVTTIVVSIVALLARVVVVVLYFWYTTSMLGRLIV